MPDNTHTEQTSPQTDNGQKQTEQTAPVIKKTPAQWGAETGHVRNLQPNLPQGRTSADWKHATADLLHGWAAHEHHYANAPILITAEEYEAALAAGAAYPAAAPAIAALSPLKHEQFANFQPRKARTEEQG